LDERVESESGRLVEIRKIAKFKQEAREISLRKDHRQSHKGIATLDALKADVQSHSANSTMVNVLVAKEMTASFLSGLSQNMGQSVKALREQTYFKQADKLRHFRLKLLELKIDPDTDTMYAEMQQEVSELKASISVCETPQMSIDQSGFQRILDKHMPSTTSSQKSLTLSADGGSNRVTSASKEQPLPLPNALNFDEVEVTHEVEGTHGECSSDDDADELLDRDDAELMTAKTGKSLIENISALPGVSEAR